MSLCKIWCGGTLVVLIAALVLLWVFFSQICLQIAPSMCEESNEGGVNFTNDGTPTDKGSWPWHATIYTVLDSTTSYRCGGTIIDKHTILTAAHCFFIEKSDSGFVGLSESQISVHVGHDHLRKSTMNVQVFEVSQITIHPEFRMPHASNDIAIVRLSSDINITDSVGPAFLWRYMGDMNEIVGTNGTAIGFISNKADNISDTLQKVTLTVMDCLVQGQEKNESFKYRNTFCAKGMNNINVCTGGGVLFNINGTWYLRGIMSEISSIQEYTVFTDTYYYLDWIHRYTNTENDQEGEVYKNALYKAASSHHHALKINPSAFPDDPRTVKDKADSVHATNDGIQVGNGTWPWHATIYTVLDNTTSYRCGGTIIDKHTILTAANCLFIRKSAKVSGGLCENQIVVRVGHNHSRASDISAQVLKVAQIIFHPDFRMDTLANDIAIVRLSSDINFTHSVGPVSLWREDNDVKQMVGTKGTVIRLCYNKEDNITETLQSVHQEASLTVVDVLACLGKDRQTYTFNSLYENLSDQKLFCAEEKSNFSACTGGGGEGWFFNLNGTWYLRGIVSNVTVGTQVDRDNSNYTTFTDTSKYTDWILRYTNTKKWLKELKKCKDGVVEENTMCNAASRHAPVFFLFISSSYIYRSDKQHFMKKGQFEYINYDCAAGQIWAAYRHTAPIYEIHVINNDGTDKQIFPNQTHQVDRLAVDWISRRLYMVDFQSDDIEVAALENPDMRTLLIPKAYARRIVVDPHQGKLFWKNELGDIEWSNLDGSDRQILINSTRKNAIEDIKVSMATGELCFSDGGTGKIECIDTRTKRIRTVVSNVTMVGGYTLLSVTDDLLYWVEWESDNINSIDRNGVLGKPIHFNSMDDAYHMEAVTDVCPVFHSQCAINNGGCRKNTICLLRPRHPLGRICKPIGGLIEHFKWLRSLPPSCSKINGF